MSVEDFGDRLGLTAQVVETIAADGVCDLMARSLEQLAEGLEREPRRAVRTLEVLGPEARARIIETWNRGEVVEASEPWIHRLFEQQARRRPDAIALVHGERELTYGELDARANRLAHQLIARGVRPDARVGLCAERSIELVIGLLAILKAGGGYVPLDPGYPEERLKELVRDAGPVLVVADAVGRRALGAEVAAPMVALDEPQSEGPAHAPEVAGLTPGHLAYVIYTSGSTGRPKGVMVEHAQVVRLFEATQGWYGFDERDVWCQFHSVAFDFSVWELWGALRYGGRLVIVPREVAQSAPAFHRLVCASGVTVLNQTPSAFRGFIEAHAERRLAHRLRYVIFGGEALEPSMLARWYAIERGSEGGPRLVNMYGITETTVHVTYRPIDERDVGAGGSPIGRGLPDLQVYVLDANQEPVPVGVVGELYIGGAGVARGYLNRPELTAERFVRDPFRGGAGARMYRTGDLARYLGDGSLEFHGRNDQQVKIRGYRIELGEIEARLGQHGEVRDAVVTACEGAAGQRQLVAYVTTRSDAPSAELAGRLRAHLAAQLPEYMVPAAYVRLEALPLTPNGKLDRKALPAPDGDAVAQRTYEAPWGEIEEVLAGVWRELLGLERVGRHDHFFELGGHSLLAVQLIGQIREALRVEISLRALFEHPVLSALARLVTTLQLEHAFGKESADQMQAELRSLSEAELRALLREEAADD